MRVTVRLENTEFEDRYCLTPEVSVEVPSDDLTLNHAAALSLDAVKAALIAGGYSAQSVAELFDGFDIDYDY